MLRVLLVLSVNLMMVSSTSPLLHFPDNYSSPTISCFRPIFDMDYTLQVYLLLEEAHTTWFDKAVFHQNRGRSSSAIPILT